MWEKPIRNGWHRKMADSILARDPGFHPVWTYDDSVVLQGMAALEALTGGRRYGNFIRRVMDSFLEEGGRRIRDYSPLEYNIDHISNGKILLHLYATTGDVVYRRAADLLMEQLRTHPRTEEGGFWHKRIYPHQMWLDGIYMAQPFYARYGAMFADGAALADVALNIRVCYRHTLDARTGLHYHAWDEKRAQPWCDPKTGCSRHFWGRAMGWFCAALVDTLDFFPAGHPQRGEIEGYLRACAEAVFAVQDAKSGVWYQILDQAGRPGNYLEASASCLFVYAFAKAMRLGILDRAYAARVRLGYAGIITQFVEEYKGFTNLNKTCQVAGLGGEQARDGSFAYYMSEPIIANDLKGAGAFLQAAVEMEGLGGMDL